ncbi:MAG: hypothetical protein NZ108_09510, partial [Bacteroidia bacterium]|nr:hypothetical protein [Bacteroidia bacterium]
MSRKTVLTGLFFVFLSGFVLTWIYIYWTFSSNEQVSYLHDWQPCHVLITLKIWNQVGFFSTGGVPIYTFSGSENAFVLMGNLGAISDSVGNFYYISYPPLGFWFPYFVFSLLDLPYNIGTLSLFNQIFCLINAIIVYQIFVVLALPTKPKLVPAGLALVYFTFPVNFFFQGRFYFVDSLATTWFLATILCLSLYQTTKLHKYLGIACLFMGFASATEWIGFLLPSLLIPIVWHHKENLRYHLIYFVITILVSITVLGLFLWLYSKPAGWEELVTALLNRYQVRSGISAAIGENQMSITDWRSWLQIA